MNNNGTYLLGRKGIMNNIYQDLSNATYVLASSPLRLVRVNPFINNDPTGAPALLPSSNHTNISQEAYNEMRHLSVYLTNATDHTPKHLSLIHI